MGNTKGLLVFCGIISALIFAYYFSPANLAWGDGTVTVSATVTTTLSCNLSTTTTDFGQLAITVVSTSTPDETITMSCNSTGGATLKVHDAGNATTTTPGLYSVNATTIITSTTALLVAGTSGYGIQAVVNGGSGTGGTLTLNATYNKSGDNVGGLTIANTDISSSSAAIANRETTVKHKAAISSLVPSATDYADTITYSCVGN